MAFASNGEGAVVSHPDDLDELMHARWKAIYDGNGEPVQVAADFVARHGARMLWQKEEVLPPLNPR
eukprot:4083376-Alexandrium_andersonii.AAC.1